MRASALLFDLDGTMLNTDPIHIAIFADLMGSYGIDADEAFYMGHVHGRLNVDVFAEFLPNVTDPQGLSDAKEAEFRRRLPSAFPAMPGLNAVLDYADAEGMKLAVVTNANRLNAEAMLEAIGHSTRFDAMIIGEECQRGKPHPEPYLRAIEALGVTPETSIAFEDSPSGIRSAHAAGAYVVGIRSSANDQTLRAAGATTTLSDFTDPALDAVLARHQGVPT